MIKSIAFNKSSARGRLSYVSSLSSIESLGGQVEFKDGLNIIVGPNGSGKSSILNCISYMLAANITGYSAISKSWLKNCEFENFFEENSPPITPATIEHDGQPIIYCNPREGISAISDSLDDGEFGIESMLDMFNGSRESSGEKSNRLLTPFINSVTQERSTPSEIPVLCKIGEINDIWIARLKVLCSTWLKANIEIGNPTIILDEPETGLSILNQILLWKKVLRNDDVLKRFQIILVSHSHECINVPGAHYIELKKGYVDTCRQALSGTIDLATIAKQASNISKPLNKRQLDLLLKIKNSDSDVIFKDNKTHQSLIKLDLMDTYKVEKKKSSDRESRPFDSFNPTYACYLTHKGNQHLELHQ